MIGNFEVVVGLDDGTVDRFYRDNNASGYPWIGPAGGFPGSPVTHVSLIRSSFGNLEVVVTNPDGALEHHWRDQSGVWHHSATFGGEVAAAGPPSLIQGTYGNEPNGNFELLVPLANDSIAHYWRDNSDPTYPWYGPTAQFAGNGGHFVALIQSDYGPPPAPGELFGGPGNLECVVMHTPDDELLHYWRDANGNWNQGAIITDLSDPPGAGGGPAFIQPGGGYGALVHRNFEVVVPTSASTLAHFYRDNSPAGGEKWVFTEQFGSGIYAAMILSSFDSLEVVVSPGLTHYWRNVGGGNWNESATFAAGNAGGAPGFVQDVVQAPIT